MATSQLIGLKEANRALRTLPKVVKIDVQQVQDVTAFQVSQAMKATVRRRTGTLARAIVWKSRPASVSAVVGVDGGDAFYWKFLEFGTVAMDAQPFARPAAESMRADHDARLRQALEKAATKMAATAK